MRVRKTEASGRKKTGKQAMLEWVTLKTQGYKVFTRPDSCLAWVSPSRPHLNVSGLSLTFASPDSSRAPSTRSWSAVRASHSTIPLRA